jgi:hypothetical protein
MNTLGVDAAIPVAESIAVTKDTLTVELSDGQNLSDPLDRFPRLVHAATQAERKRWRLIGEDAAFIGIC